MKRCKQCQQIKPATEFAYAQGRKTPGSRSLSHRCLACTGESDRGRTHAAKLKSEVIKRLGFWPDGCDNCLVAKQCASQGLWVDPPCALPDEVVRHVLSQKP